MFKTGGGRNGSEMWILKILRILVPIHSGQFSQESRVGCFDAQVGYTGDGMNCGRGGCGFNSSCGGAQKRRWPHCWQGRAPAPGSLESPPRKSPGATCRAITPGSQGLGALPGWFSPCHEPLKTRLVQLLLEAFWDPATGRRRDRVGTAVGVRLAPSLGPVRANRAQVSCPDERASSAKRGLGEHV
ncbi:unnamed protein product [Durusdinium trenchii]|uniref:Uncharacterized protein n=1 Tax=Durusdinium trenchii TaxID=1381693 RepID=A0ABP0N9B6_9DINO